MVYQGIRGSEGVRMATVAVGGIWHETNTFATSRTTRARFEEYQYGLGDDLVTRFTGVRTEVGGMLDGASAHDWDVVPTVFAGAVPSGLVTADAFSSLLADLVDRIPADVDAVLLSLHGAMVVEGVDDADGEVASAVRRAVGPGVPVVASLDFHANVSERLFAATDALVGYDTYPHVDPFERGREAADVVGELLDGRSLAGRAFAKLSLLTAPAAQQTAAPPMKTLFDAAHDVEASPGVRVVTVSPGFAYADVAHLGLSIAAYGDDADAVKAGVERLADLAWSLRHEFVTADLSPAEAVTRATAGAAPDGPVVLVDVADNIGGGAPGDGTVLLAELLAQRADGAVVVIADPEAAVAAADAGVGATVELDLGGHTDRMHGDPVRVRGVVRHLGDGRFVHRGSYMTGQETCMGRTAVVAADGVEIVVTERPTMPFDAEQLRSQGIEPADRRILVVKSAIAWRAAFGDLAADAIPVATPGICTSDLSNLPYRNVRRPIHPLDDL